MYEVQQKFLLLGFGGGCVCKIVVFGCLNMLR